MDNATKEDPESSPTALPKLPQANNLLKKGLVFIVAAYAVMILYHFIVSKGLAVQPLARCGLAVVLGVFAYKGWRWSTRILFLLAIAWILESLIGATRENLEWHARGIFIIRGILTGFGLYYLWNTIREQKKEWITKFFEKMDLQKVSISLDSTTQPFLERMTHLFNAGFGTFQIKEVLELSRKLENKEQKTFIFSPLHNLKKVPLKVVIEQDNFSPTINFFSTREVAEKLNVMKAMG